jgi:hypothetical protein
VWQWLGHSTPPWALALCVFLFVYSFVNFFVSLALLKGGAPAEEGGYYYLKSHGSVLRELTAEEYARYRGFEMRLFSGHWMLFYALGVLGSHALCRDASSRGTAGQAAPGGRHGGDGWWNARLPQSWPLQRVLLVPGVLANVFLVCLGFTWVLPSLGPVGIIWIVVMAGITAITIHRLIAWPHRASHGERNSRRNA